MIWPTCTCLKNTINFPRFACNETLKIRKMINFFGDADRSLFTAGQLKPTDARINIIVVWEKLGRVIVYRGLSAVTLSFMCHHVFKRQGINLFFFPYLLSCCSWAPIFRCHAAATCNEFVPYQVINPPKNQPGVAIGLCRAFLSRAL